jgi:homoserine O-acetyltransferase
MASQANLIKPPRARAKRADFNLVDFEITLPRPLKRFGTKVQASILGPDDAPVVIVLGGISANRFPCRAPDGARGWWSGLACKGGAADPSIYRILGIDFAADESGHIAPSTLDQAQVVCAVLDELGVARAHAIVGASYGGMVALSFAQHFPDRVGRLVIVCAPAEPHPISTATREIQRRIVAFGLANNAGAEGLSLARGLAMLTYRSPQEFEERFKGGIASEDALGRSEPGSYLHARGQAYRSAMSPGRFISLSASIDRHRVEPEEISISALIIGSASDQLVPPPQLTALASRYGGPAALHILPSLYGHDMFLKQAEQVSELAGPFLRSTT